MITVEPILLDVDVSVEEFDLEVNDETAVDFELETAINVIQIGGDPYEGPYSVVPSFDTQTLSTSHKVMRNDVIVNPVTYSLATRTDIDRLF